MEWKKENKENKENKMPPGDKTARRGSKAAEGSQPLAEGAKEKKGFMRRILRGGGGGERTLGLKNTPENTGGTGGAGGAGGAGVQEEPLTSPAVAAEPNPPPPASSPSHGPQQVNTATLRVGGARKKNFVKANMLAAASARNLRSTTNLERQPRSLALTPGGAGATGRLATTSSRLGGSARSLNSEPGGAGGAEETGKARNPELRKSFHFGKASRRPRDRETLEVPRRTVITRKSISEAPEIILTPLVQRSLSVRRARGTQSGSTGEFPPGLSLSLSAPAPVASGPAGLELIENLTARVDQLELVVEQARNDLRISVALVEKNGRKHEEDLKNVLEMNKCQLESQRLEFKEEIRKLLSFKDNVSVRTKEKSGDQNVAQTDSFRNTSDRLLNKIHRLSARMSLQDSDMKELIQVKGRNEKKLDSAKKNPLGRLLNVPDLQSCSSQSEPDLARM